MISSVILDFLGMFTYAIPILGELGDIVFAPFYMIAIIVMYRKHLFSAFSGGFVGFFEEILPGTDFFPTATIMWTYTFVFKKERALNDFVQQNLSEKRSVDKMLE